MLKIHFALLILVMLQACSSIPPSQPNQLYPASNLTFEEQYEQLMFFYFQWKGVPHQDGGASLNGVDCSGLMVRSFQEVYGVNLPRTTERQSKKGLIVGKDELRTGDLVFFKTGVKQLHVGVYMKANIFLHASSSKGVMLSKLDNPYWRKNYWHSRRIIY